MLGNFLVNLGNFLYLLRCRGGAGGWGGRVGWGGTVAAAAGRRQQGPGKGVTDVVAVVCYWAPGRRGLGGRQGGEVTGKGNLGR
jgi:hypothetical protein